jgi:hypothetical protein
MRAESMAVSANEFTLTDLVLNHCSGVSLPGHLHHVHLLLTPNMIKVHAHGRKVVVAIRTRSGLAKIIEPYLEFGNPSRLPLRLLFSVRLCVFASAIIPFSGFTSLSSYTIPAMPVVSVLAARPLIERREILEFSALAT